MNQLTLYKVAKFFGIKLVHAEAMVPHHRLRASTANSYLHCDELLSLDRSAPVHLQTREQT